MFIDMANVSTGKRLCSSVIASDRDGCGCPASKARRSGGGGSALSEKGQSALGKNPPEFAVILKESQFTHVQQLLQRAHPATGHLSVQP
jgi:hypothetical protein